jgi:hypothetical protein
MRLWISRNFKQSLARPPTAAHALPAPIAISFTCLLWRNQTRLG